MTLEDFDKATKGNFKPKTMEEAVKDTEKSLKERGKKAIKKVTKKK